MVADTFPRHAYPACPYGRLMAADEPACHRRPRRHPRLRSALGVFLLFVMMAAGIAMVTSAGASASVAPGTSVAAPAPHTVVLASTTVPKRLRAFYAARTRAGDPYVYGANGPSAFDCSGLVQWAYERVGYRNFPRDTFEMLAAVATGLLQPTNRPVKGDLAFYGSGHVELFVRWGHTFGAHDSNLPVGWIHYGWGWVPTMFFHVRGAG